MAAVRPVQIFLILREEKDSTSRVLVTLSPSSPHVCISMDRTCSDIA